MIITKPWVYESVDRVFEGSISYNDDIQTQKPGILISHAYGGCSEFEIRKAKGLAELGYVGFAIDLYGQGRRGSSPEESTALMIELDGDRGLLSKRINHSLSLLKEHKEVDSSKTAAVGFCFGGKCVLDLARSGADINGIISFHGIYDKPNIENKSPIKASILILHGFEDPLALPDSMIMLGEELKEKNIDWQIHVYGGAAHAFTNPQATDKQSGLYYEGNADRRSWLAMKNFLKEIFK